MKFIQCVILLFLPCFVMAKTDQSAYLPKAVTYCGPLEDYFLGNGVSGAMGTPDGTWSALFGPNYTAPNFIQSEILNLNMDGYSYQIKPEMHRLRETGIYSGVYEKNGVSVTVTDFSRTNQPWVTRLLTIHNHSGRAIKLSVNAQIIAKDIQPQLIDNKAVLLHADTSKWNFSDCWQDSKNWNDRYAIIAFNVNSKAKITGVNQSEIQTNEISISKDGTFQLSLYHHLFYPEKLKNTGAILHSIKKRNTASELKQSVSEWQHWYRKGKDFSAKISDLKARDIVEGAQIAIKMLQDSSGGIHTGLRAYPNGYIRDSHGASRLFQITQRNDELKKLVLAASAKTVELGYVPNSWPLGYKGVKNQLFHNRDSETPAYFILMAKYYFENTNDTVFLRKVFPAMQIAINCQLAYLKANQWRIDFNGDETEKYTVRVDGQMYGYITNFTEDEWSLPSATLAIASLDFNIKGATVLYRNFVSTIYQQALENIKDAIDTTFWRDDLNVLDWCRKRDGSFPNYRVTNYLLFPEWIGVELNKNREISTALYSSRFIDSKTGYLPTAPTDAEGFSGHNLAYYIYVMKKLNKQEEADKAMKTYLNGGIISAWGTVSEFYGPNGTPNGHLHNPFSTGIMGEAIIKYYIGF